MTTGPGNNAGAITPKEETKMTKMFNLNKWKNVAPKTAVNLHAPQSQTRRITLELMSGQPVRLYVTDETSDETLVALFCGRETVEFYGVGNVSIMGDADFAIYTAELEPARFPNVEPVVFARIAERTARNPQMEAIVQRLQQQVAQQLAASNSAHARELAQLRNEMKVKNNGNDLNTTAGDAGEAKSKPVAKSGEPNGSVGEDGAKPAVPAGDASGPKT